MLDASATPSAETACVAPGSLEAKAAATPAAVAQSIATLRLAKRKAATDAAPSPAVNALGEISVFVEARQAEIRKRTTEQRRDQWRNYSAIPEIKPRGVHTVIASQSPVPSLPEMAEHFDRGNRRLRGWPDPKPGEPPHVAALCRWSSANLSEWAMHALVDSRERDQPISEWMRLHGNLSLSDRRPEILLWAYAQAEQYRPMVTEFAARTILNYAGLRRYNVSNRQMAWLTNDAVERCYRPEALKQRVRQEAARRAAIEEATGVRPEVVGDEPYCADAARAKFLAMRLSRYVELRNVGERVINKAIKNGLLRYEDAVGNDAGGMDW